MTEQANLQKCSEGTEIMAELISVGLIKIDSLNYQGLKPLHVAVKNNKCLLAESLLQNRADVNAKNREGETPLAMAVRFLLPKMVKLLLQHEAKINKINQKGVSALWLATGGRGTQSQQAEQQEILDSIFQHGLRSKNNSEVNYYKLCKAIINKNFRSAKRLIDSSKDINFKDIQAENPLRFAVHLDQLEIAELFLKKGVSRLNCQSALAMAVKKENLKMTELLLRFQTDVNFEMVLSDNWRQTPLYCATEQKNVELMRTLLRNGADVNGSNCVGSRRDTALHSACKKGFYEGIKLLLEYKAQVNLRDFKGRTPLHYACGRNTLASIELLVERGAEITATDDGGLTILHFVANHWKLDVLKYVINLAMDKGISINARNKNGYTAFNDIFCDNLVEFLKNGADLNVRAKSGRYPTHGFFDEYRDDDYESDYDCTAYDFLGRLRCLNYEMKNPLTVRFYKKIKPSGFLYQELEELKIEVIAWNPKTSLYNVLFMSRKSVVQYSKNVNLRKAFAQCNNDFETKYPNFGCFLNLQLRRGSSREDLMNIARDNLQKVLGKSLPDVCSDMIFKYLKNEKLKNFSKDDLK